MYIYSSLNSWKASRHQFHRFLTPGKLMPLLCYIMGIFQMLAICTINRQARLSHANQQRVQRRLISEVLNVSGALRGSHEFPQLVRDSQRFLRGSRSFPRAAEVPSSAQEFSGVGSWEFSEAPRFVQSSHWIRVASQRFRNVPRDSQGVSEVRRASQR